MARQRIAAVLQGAVIGKGSWRPARMGLLLVVATLLLQSGQSGWAAAPTYLFKVASVAPQGSIWAQRFQAFVKEVATRTNGEVDFRVYFGGVMGDDRAMHRKMQVGQLHGGGFTMTGIGAVVPDFRVMGIPFLFRSYEEVDLVRHGLDAAFKKAFADKGMEFLAFTEVGFVYAMSTTPVTTLAQFQRGKCWVPEGDPVSAAFLQAIGVSPIPLTIPDVLTSLQTGMIDTVFNALYGSIALQWFTRARFVTDIPFGYAYGAFLLDRRKFAALPDEYAAIVRQAARHHFEELLQDTRKSNEESRTILMQNKVSFVQPSQETLADLKDKRNAAVPDMIGQAFSADIYDQTMRILNQQRR